VNLIWFRLVLEQSILPLPTASSQMIPAKLHRGLTELQSINLLIGPDPSPPRQVIASRLLAVADVEVDDSTGRNTAAGRALVAAGIEKSEENK
jgi:hypothetical protein